MSADSLTELSRAFFEVSKEKLTYSLISAALALTFLGLTSVYGGLSNHATIMLDSNIDDNNMEDYYEALSAGYGFGCFVCLMGFIVVLFGACYLSPLITGTNDEKTTIFNPLEIESYSANNRPGFQRDLPSPYNSPPVAEPVNHPPYAPPA